MGVTRLSGAVLAAVTALIAGLALAPVCYLVWQTAFADGAPTLSAFERAYAAPGLGSMMTNSLLFAAGATSIAVLLGTVLAFVLTRTDAPWRPVLFIAALVPLVMPGILHAVAWVFLASPRSGALNRALAPLIGPESVNVFSLGGMIVVEGLSLTPLVLLLMAAAFRSHDASLEESAMVAGAPLRAVVTRITIPLVRPALLASTFLVMVRALEAFEMPAVLGIPGNVWVFTSRIWRALNRFPADYGQAGASSLLLLVLTAAGLLAYTRAIGRGRRFETVTGRGRSPAPMPLGRWRRPAAILVCGYVTVAVVLPLLILVYTSTQPFYEPPSLKGLSRMSLTHYADALGDRRLWRAIRNSLLVSTAAATSVMALTAVAAWLVVRTRIRGRRLLDVVASLPIAVPGLVLGVALLTALVRSPLPVYGTLWILLLAYVTRALPFGIRYASVGMLQISAELEDAAAVSGAGWSQTMRRVLLPLSSPAMAAGWLYITIISVRELSASLLLYSPRTEVVTVRIWEHYQDGAFPELAALGVLMMAFLTIAGAIVYRLGLVAEVGRQ